MRWRILSEPNPFMCFIIGHDDTVRRINIMRKPQLSNLRFVTKTCLGVCMSPTLQQLDFLFFLFLFLLDQIDSILYHIWSKKLRYFFSNYDQLLMVCQSMQYPSAPFFFSSIFLSLQPIRVMGIILRYDTSPLCIFFISI